MNSQNVISPASAKAAARRGATETLRVSVVQDGARLHYALPLALARVGILEKVFTEFFVTPASLEGAIARAVRLIKPALGSRMAERKCSELAPSSVRRNWRLALRQMLARGRFSSEQEFFRWSSEMVGRWVQREGLGDANALMGFILNIDPGLCAWAREQGLLVVGDQMGAPIKVFMQHCLEESARWPGWEPMGTEQEMRSRYAIAIDVEERTWPHLDHVTCASAYVKRGLESQGVDGGRITQISYPIDAAAYAVPDRRGRFGPVTVGCVGRVSLLKGAPYFFEVARRLNSAAVKFVFVGPVALQDSVVGQQKGNVELIGPVPRSQVASWLQKFDLFFFPSVSEGSSGAVMEAMCAALPVVVSTNSGSIARDGLEGFSAPYDDIDALAAHVQRLVSDENLRLEMGRAARLRAEAMNLDEYSRRLSELLARLRAAPKN